MLTIDIGNSRIKWVQWDDRSMVCRGASGYDKEQLPQQLSTMFAELQTSRIVIASVADDAVNLHVRHWFIHNWQLEPEFVKSQKQQLGVVNSYLNPESMGVDRWMALLAAYEKYQQALCVIDCGTAVTFDVLSSEGMHQGGLIMPGVYMMQQALFRDTDRVNIGAGKLVPLANNTSDAVYSGCLQLLASGLDGLCMQQSVDDGLLCVLTGGDGELLAGLMNCHCSYEPDLILYGLQAVSR